MHRNREPLGGGGDLIELKKKKNYKESEIFRVLGS